MSIRTIFNAVAALSLAAAPTVASAQATPEPTTETVEGEQIRGGFLLPLTLVVAVLLGVLLLTGDEEDPEISP